MKRDAIQTYRMPFTIEEAMDELKLALWCNAAQIALSGPEELAFSYIGFNIESWTEDDASRYMDQVDLSRFEISTSFRHAYNFAFQTGNHNAFDEDLWLDIGAFKGGAARNDWAGLMSPIALPESKLCHVADMALARMALRYGNPLSIRYLSLLGNMTEAAVRTALSAEGIKTEGRPASLTAEKAEKWLMGRRGFVPTKESGSDGAITLDDIESQIIELPLSEGMPLLLSRKGINTQDLAAASGSNVEMLRSLVLGEHVTQDIPTLIRLAGCLDLDPQVFISWISKNVLSMSEHQELRN